MNRIATDSDIVRINLLDLGKIIVSTAVMAIGIVIWIITHINASESRLQDLITNKVEKVSTRVDHHDIEIIKLVESTNNIKKTTELLMIDKYKLPKDQPDPP